LIWPEAVACRKLLRESPAKEILPEAELMVMSPEVLVMVEEAPAMSSLAPGVVVPIPTLPEVSMARRAWAAVASNIQNEPSEPERLP